MSNSRRLLFVSIVVLATSSLAHAQGAPETGGRVAGTFGGSFGDGGSTLAATGSAGIRFTRYLGVDFELMYVPDLDLSERYDVVLLLRAGETTVVRAGKTTVVGGGLNLEQLPIILPFNREARVIAFFSKIAAEFPVANRLWPYITGGGGAAQLTERYRFFPGPIILAGERGTTGVTIFPPPNLPARLFEHSEINLGLTVGGGVDVRVWRSLAAGLDVRYVRFLGQSQDLDLAHVSARLSYRF